MLPKRDANLELILFEEKDPRFTRLKPGLALRSLSKGLFYITAMYVKGYVFQKLLNEKEGDLKLNIDFGSPCDLEKRVFVSNTLDSKRCWWIDSLNFPHLYFVHQRRG